MPNDNLRSDCEAIYRAALAAADPGECLRRELDRGVPPGGPPGILAVGKAAWGMADAARRWLKTHELEPGSTVAVAHAKPAAPWSGVDLVLGDHPVPGANSVAASQAVTEWANSLKPNSPAWVLVSGGASSLIAEPLEPLTLAQLQELWRLLLASGLPISAINEVRRKLVRHGAGRLAARLGVPETRCYLLSDVPGDDPADIGSGPCVADPRPVPVQSLLEDYGLWRRLDSDLHASLRAVDRLPPTVVGSRSLTAIIGSNRIALAGAAREADARGFAARIAGTISGEAATVGREIARTVLEAGAAQPTCLLWGGETTVELGPGSGSGGRCQELALAAAEELALADTAAAVMLLAAGTDGRDGPTDAAGAVVDRNTWNEIISRGVDPGKALANHDSNSVLDRGGYLLRPGPTGTNVMDVVVGLTIPRPA